MNSSSNKLMIFGCKYYFAKFRGENKNPHITTDTEYCLCEEEHFQTLAISKDC